MAVLRRVHVALIRMVRAGPEVASRDVVADSCPVRAERGGELTGPDPTDRGKAGTEYRVVVSTEGTPPGFVPSYQQPELLTCRRARSLVAPDAVDRRCGRSAEGP